MNKLLLIFLFTVLSASVLPAQVNFTAGGIIQQNGDTLRGEIDYREWDLNPRKIQFRISPTAENRSFDCRSISGFYISGNDEIYQTAIVNLNMEASTMRDMPTYETVKEALGAYKPVRDTVFLLVLTRGGINLFEYTDNNRTHYLVQMAGGNVEELVFRKFMRATVLMQRNNGLEVVHIDQYKQQLKTMTAACADLKINFDKISYDKNHLLQVVNKFNRCVHNTGYIQPETKTEKSLWVIAGAGIPVFKVSGSYTQNRNINATGGIVPLVGLEYNFNFSRKRGRRGAGLGVYASQYSTRKEETQPNDNMVVYDADMAYIRLYAFYRQTLGLGKFQPYIKVGAGASHYFKADYYYSKTFGIYDPIIYSRQMKQNDVCLLGGIGLKMNRLSLEARFEWGSNLAYLDASELSKGNMISLVAGYRLLK